MLVRTVTISIFVTLNSYAIDDRLLGAYSTELEIEDNRVYRVEIQKKPAIITLRGEGKTFYKFHYFEQQQGRLRIYKILRDGSLKPTGQGLCDRNSCKIRIQIDQARYEIHLYNHPGGSAPREVNGLN